VKLVHSLFNSSTVMTFSVFEGHSLIGSYFKYAISYLWHIAWSLCIAELLVSNSPKVRFSHLLKYQCRHVPDKICTQKNFIQDLGVRQKSTVCPWTKIAFCTSVPDIAFGTYWLWHSGNATANPISVLFWHWLTWIVLHVHLAKIDNIMVHVWQ